MRLPVVAIVLFCACRARPPERTIAPSVASSTVVTTVDAGAPDPFADARVHLPIPARSQAAESPPAGWCGETAIQEGLLYLGVWAPQKLINAAGRPSHPDLYARDIPVALASLGVRFTTYSASRRGFEPFAAWIRRSIDEGDPVLAGVKILPTEHPEWGLDHFVLVVGHGDKGLLVNTTWGHSEWVRDPRSPGVSEATPALRPSSAPALSFENAFYAIRLAGISEASGRARIELLDESARSAKLRITCRAAGRIERTEGGAVVWSGNLDAQTQAIDLTIDADRPARFRCAAQ